MRNRLARGLEAEAAGAVHAGLPSGILEWSTTSGHLFWSSSIEKLLGFVESDFRRDPQTLTDLLHPGDVGAVASILEDEGEVGRPCPVNFRIRNASGRYLRVSALIQPCCMDEMGTPTRMIAVVEDNSLGAVEDVLWASEAAFQDMAAHIPGAIVRYRLGADGREDLEYMSPGCEELWELTFAQLNCDPSLLWKMVLPEDLPATRASVDESARTLTPWSCRWRIRTPSGKLKWLHGRGHPRRLDDGAILWISFIQDVTEQVETHQALQKSQAFLHQSQKMEALGQLTSGLAHDFNNLLTVIYGALELLQQTPEEQDQLIKEALQAAKQGSELTSSLLSFARQAKLGTELVEIDKALRQLQPVLARTLPGRVEFLLEVNGPLPLVSLDRATFESSILNLVINARDALPEGGRIILRVEGIEAKGMDGLPDGPAVRIQVNDNGVGIEPALLGKVLEPFFTTKLLGGGSGLGLAMVHGFVQQAGGILQVASTSGVGTEISMLFPGFSGELKDAPVQPLEPPILPKGLRILLVEDAPQVREVLRKRLSIEGALVATAHDGASAVEQLRPPSAYDIVICDVELPGPIQGYHLAEEVRNRFPTLPILFLSGAQGLPKFIFGRSTLVKKPASRNELLEAIIQLLEE